MVKFIRKYLKVIYRNAIEQKVTVKLSDKITLPNIPQTHPHICQNRERAELLLACWQEDCAVSRALDRLVQENLGHHSASFTLDVYGHVTDKMCQDSAERMENYIKALRG